MHRPARFVRAGFLPTLVWASHSVICPGQNSKLPKPVGQSGATSPFTKNSTEKMTLTSDHQFDDGSGIVLRELSPVQIENLVTLGKVWGFLKYYHPLVTAGQRQWDYDLFRIMPAVLAARDRATANQALVRWIEDMGEVPSCNRCAKLDEKDLHLRPDLNWIENSRSLGGNLCDALITIRDNRVPRRQFYVSMVANIGNPNFDRELGYTSMKFPDAGFQLLALYRFWNIVEYWSPYRDWVAADWDHVLAEFIPRIALAPNADAYKLELIALIAKLRDGHANLWSSLDVRPPVGKCHLPVRVRFVENQAVITGFAAAGGESPSELKVGDVITELDGIPVSQLVDKWAPYYAASNDTARLRDIGNSMTRGECGEVSVGVRREDRELKISVTRVPPAKGGPGGFTHDLPGPTFRLLSKDVAYLKLSSVKAADVSHYIEQAAGTKGLIIDIRNYPSDFVVFALGSLLVSSETAFVRFTQGDLSNPGAFHWGPVISLRPQQPHYSGKVVILVDEISQSQAEYTTMALRSARGAIVVGSQTAGADGNVSPIPLPGGLRTMISGISVFYPDKAPTQGIGIVPNVEVKPTVAGIRAGRDEVLEEAVRQVLGREVPEAEIEKIAKPAL